MCPKHAHSGHPTASAWPQPSPALWSQGTLPALTSPQSTSEKQSIINSLGENHLKPSTPGEETSRGKVYRAGCESVGVRV